MKTVIQPDEYLLGVIHNNWFIFYIFFNDFSMAWGQSPISDCPKAREDTVNYDTWPKQTLGQTLWAMPHLYSVHYLKKKENLAPHGVAS